jgi:hypothetical protein
MSVILEAALTTYKFSEMGETRNAYRFFFPPVKHTSILLKKPTCRLEDKTERCLLRREVFMIVAEWISSKTLSSGRRTCIKHIWNCQVGCYTWVITICREIYWTISNGHGKVRGLCSCSVWNFVISLFQLRHRRATYWPWFLSGLVKKKIHVTDTHKYGSHHRSNDTSHPFVKFHTTYSTFVIKTTRCIEFRYVLTTQDCNTVSRLFFISKGTLS